MAIVASYIREHDPHTPWITEQPEIVDLAQLSDWTNIHAETGNTTLTNFQQQFTTEHYST